MSVLTSHLFITGPTLSTIHSPTSIQ